MLTSLYSHSSVGQPPSTPITTRHTPYLLSSLRHLHPQLTSIPLGDLHTHPTPVAAGDTTTPDPESIGYDPFYLEISGKDTPPACDCKGHHQYMGTEVFCHTHDTCNPTLPTRICLTCKQRYCANCFNDVHNHPLLSGCASISYTTFTDAKRLFAEHGRLDATTHRTLLECDTMLHHVKPYFRNPRAAKRVINTIRTLRAKFSPTYQLTLLAFLEAYTHETMLLFNPTNSGTLARFHQLGCLGRCFQRLGRRRATHTTGFLWFHQLAAHLRSLFGDHVYLYILTIIHLILVNLVGVVVWGLMLLLPYAMYAAGAIAPSSHVSYAGVANGDPTSIAMLPLFYGAFPPDASPVDFRLLWFLAIAVMFFVGTIFILFHMATSRPAAAGASSVTSPMLMGSVSTAVLAMFDHSSTNSAGEARLARQNYDASIRMTLVNKYHQHRQRSIWSRMCNRNLCALLMALLLAVAGPIVAYIVHYVLQHHDALASAPAWLTPLVFPCILLVLRRFGMACIRQLVQCEIPKRTAEYNRFRATLFYRCLLHDLCYYVVILIMLYRSRDTMALPTATIVDQLQRGYCNGQASAPCTCPESSYGIAIYQYILTMLYLEVLFLVLRSLWYGLQRCCCGGSTPANPTKGPATLFSPIEKLNSVLFIQLLTWAVFPFFPAVALLSLVVLVVWFHLTYFRLTQLSVIPLHGVYLLPSKLRLTRVLMLLLFVSFLPTAYFLSTSSACGPFVHTAGDHQTVFSSFLGVAATFPVVLRQVFDYITNPMLLWVTLVAVLVYIVVMRTQSRLMRETRDRAYYQLQYESRERNRALQEIGVNYHDEEMHGAKLFVEWTLRLEDITASLDPTSDAAQVLQQNPGCLAYYAQKLQKREGNMIALCRLSDEQLCALLATCCPEDIARVLLASLKSFRNELLLSKHMRV